MSPHVHGRFNVHVHEVVYVCHEGCDVKGDDWLVAFVMVVGVGVVVFVVVVGVVVGDGVGAVGRVVVAVFPCFIQLSRGMTCKRKKFIEY